MAFLPALAWTLAEWVKAGPVYAFGVGAAGVLAVVAIRRRSLKLCVTADGRGVGTAGWFSKRRWDWDAISSIDYVPTRRRFVGTFYRGRVMLTSGQVHLVSALSGSVAGTKDADARHRAFIAQLREELDRRVPVNKNRLAISASLQPLGRITRWLELEARIEFIRALRRICIGRLPLAAAVSRAVLVWVGQIQVRAEVIAVVRTTLC